MNQFKRLSDITLVGRCGTRAVDQVRLGIGLYVSLHAKVSVADLLDLMYSRIPFATCVFGRSWYFNKRGINHGAVLEQQTTLRQHRIDFFEEPASPLVLFKQVPKVQDGGFAWSATTGQRQTCELIHFCQKFVARCLFMLGNEFNFKKTQLGHDEPGSFSRSP